MRISFDLPDHLADNLRRLAAFKKLTPDEYAQWLVVGSAESAVFPAELTTEEWIAELKAWAASHKPLEHPADDSRESIYEGRGE